MALYRGRPIDASEVYAEEGGPLGASLHKSGYCWYKLAHETVTIFSLDRCKTRGLVGPRFGDPVLPDRQHVGDLSRGLAPSSKNGDEAPKSPPLVYWQECKEGHVPEDAVYVGKDRDHGSLYVGRAYIFGYLMPGKVAVQHRVCYVALDGKEYALGIYEVLVVKGGGVKWVHSTDGYLPPNALPTGYNLQGDTIYSAKAKCQGIDTPGHFIPAEKKCCISYNVEEHNFTEFDILTIDPNVE